jgi:bla regulator protein blaR1
VEYEADNSAASVVLAWGSNALRRESSKCRKCGREIPPAGRFVKAKFLVPFSLLMSLGSHLRRVPTSKKIATQAVSFTVVQITQLFSDTSSFATSTPRTTQWIPIALLGLWLCGFGVITRRLFTAWLRIRAAVRSSTPLEMTAKVDVRSSPGLLEPGVVGLLRPILLLPAGIIEVLTKPQFEAVVIHEQCHIKRRDNLTAAIHMIVEAVFWFHPFVWWVGARLVEERERACDEDVLRLGVEPQVYAEGILKVCEFYVESPLTCVAGVTGKNLKKRMERIMRNHVGESLNIWRKLLLATAGMVAVAAPIMFGLLNSAQSRAASGSATRIAEARGKQAFETASLRQNNTGSDTSSMSVPLGPGDIYPPSGGVFSARNVALISYIYFAYDLSGAQFQLLLPHLPNWVIRDRFDIQAQARGNPTKSQMRLMMQTLLAHRFKLSVHYETQQLPVLALILATPGKTGPQLHLHLDDPPCSYTGPQWLSFASASGSPSTLPNGLPADCSDLVGLSSTSGRQRVGARNVSIALLANWLPQIGNFDRAVVDKTGLNGNFDLKFEWSPQHLNPPPPPQQSRLHEPGATFLQDLKEQLGLTLKSQTGPVEVFIVDHVEKPSEN